MKENHNGNTMCFVLVLEKNAPLTVGNKEIKLRSVVDEIEKRQMEYISRKNL